LYSGVPFGPASENCGLPPVFGGLSVLQRGDGRAQVVVPAPFGQLASQGQAVVRGQRLPDRQAQPAGEDKQDAGNHANRPPPQQAPDPAVPVSTP
jgi:hypothetical protein